MSLLRKIHALIITMKKKQWRAIELCLKKITHRQTKTKQCVRTRQGATIIIASWFNTIMNLDTSRRPIWINTPCGLNHAVTVGFCLFSKLTQTSKRNNTKLLQEPQFGCAKMQRTPSILACMLFAPRARLPRGQVLPPPAGGSGKGQYMNPAIVRNKFICCRHCCCGCYKPCIDSMKLPYRSGRVFAYSIYIAR
jgi:hypothetical protein